MHIQEYNNSGGRPLSAHTTFLSRRSLMIGGAALAAGWVAPARAAPLASLGSRSVEVVSDGAFELPMSMIARDRPAEEVLALYRADNLPTDTIRNVLNVTLIRDGDDLTLIDCGSGDRFLPGSGKLIEALDGAGIDRAKVSRVLLTHAHPDHLWGAVDSFDELSFPNATFHLSAADHAFWSSPDAASRLPEDRAMFAAGALRVLKALDGRIKTFQPGAEVAPGIVAIDTAGHTIGHTSFAVSGGGKTLVVLGDALTNAAISFRRPEWKSGSDQDADKAIATRLKLLDMLAKDRLPFIGYHLPVPGLGRTEAKDGAWRFIAGA